MPQPNEPALELVHAAICGRNTPSCASAQELPQLDLVGAAIARAARLAAADHRARLPRLGLANTQAAGLLKADRREMDALFEDLNQDEGRVIPATGATGGFVWRFHAAPAPVGAAIANERGNCA
ncbi:MAG: hypothetical protein LW636_00385 [Planctomycetaceae bacterium]|jgi:hypothetical protein|nr:hypothetical protein [Planctomycetaceae bacterium]